MVNKKQKILVIEDDEAIIRLYTIKLESAGYKVETARNGEEGLVAAKEANPDLILLDLLMPVMNGEEMLEKMRSKKWGELLRVIVLTNVSKDEAPLSLRSLGVEDYLVKALYTPTQIVEKIEKVLDN